MVIWITGLSGAGKTTLCKTIYERLKPRIPALVLLDGDVVRAAFGRDLSYREEDRIIQVKRLQGMAKLVSEQGLVVLVAVLYSNPDLLSWNRRHFDEYFEIYLRASPETLRARDPKGLYARAARGEERNVVGVDIPWYPPTSPDMIIEVDRGESPETEACRVIGAVPSLAAICDD